MPLQENFDDLVVRFAVTEALTLHLAAFLIDGAESPREAALALLSDLKGTFSIGGEPGIEAFEKLARRHIDHLEPRLLNLLRPEPADH